MTMTAKKHILIVCTGNTCRSPMAQGWLIYELKRKGLSDVTVSSCGIFARKGAPISFEADLVLKNEEIDISSHKSTPASKELIDQATHIVVLSEEHRQGILEHSPEAKDKIHVLGIEDPIGMDLQIYKDCYEKIKMTLKEEWSWLTE